jgi:hypothetical protein
VVAGLKYPVLAAAMCAAYSFARIIYTIGYKSGQPKRVCLVLAVVLNIISTTYTAHVGSSRQQFRGGR